MRNRDEDQWKGEVTSTTTKNPRVTRVQKGPASEAEKKPQTPHRAPKREKSGKVTRQRRKDNNTKRQEKAEVGCGETGRSSAVGRAEKLEQDRKPPMKQRKRESHNTGRQ